MISPNKRYQVFISSTFTDLKEERAEVTQAILELGHMPYGMEAFPAANETQWEWIQRAIEESDYYIVIIGGKYGSINPKTNISYTEMEYRYANEVGIPNIAFIVDDSVDLSKSKIDTEPIKIEKLSAFKKYIEDTKLRKSYISKEDLKAKVCLSFLQLTRQFPREGWIKANSLKDYTSNSEVLKLVKENQSLKNSKECYEQGEDMHQIEYSLYKDEFPFLDNFEETLYHDYIDLTWDEIFFRIAENLYKQETMLEESNITQLIESLISNKIVDKIESLKKEKECDIILSITKTEVETILLQFETLRYMILTNGLYWRLTKTGRNYYIAHMAIKR